MLDLQHSNLSSIINVLNSQSVQCKVKLLFKNFNSKSNLDYIKTMSRKERKGGRERKEGKGKAQGRKEGKRKNAHITLP